MCLGRCGSADPVLLPGGVRVLRPRLYGRVHPRHAPRYATGLRPRVAERRAFRGSLVQAEGAVRACGSSIAGRLCTRPAPAPPVCAPVNRYFG